MAKLLAPPRKPVDGGIVQYANGEDLASDLTIKHELETAAERIKQEGELGCKECALCAGRTDDTFDVFTETTCIGQVLLATYICKVANINMNHEDCSQFACYSCFELINFIERAEIEYLKQREILLDIISRNPALANAGTYETLEIEGVKAVKEEVLKIEHVQFSDDDVPLIALPSLRGKLKTELNREASPHDRKNSSDEDFYWKEEKVEDTVENSQTNRITAKKKAKVPREKNKKIKAHEKSLNPKKTRERAGPLLKKFTGPPLSSERIHTNPDRKWPYICEVCGKGFQIRRWCDAHVLLHQGLADYKCIPCDKLFPTKFAFLRHDKIHNGIPSHQCDLCGKSFIHKSSLRKHKLAHAGVREHACDLCGLAFASNSKLGLHRTVHTGEKNFECDGCGRKFSRKSNMQMHYQRRHARAAEDPERPPPPSPPDMRGNRRKVFRCELCPEKFDRLFKMECHLVDEHGVHLKKGRPKPRNTMKMQRARQAFALVVRASAAAAATAPPGAAAAARVDPPASATCSSINNFSGSNDIKPSVSTLNALMEAGAGTSDPRIKTVSPFVDPTAEYVSP